MAGKKIGTFFNPHPNGVVDKRTDLYYLETVDMGEKWTTLGQETLSIPVIEKDSPSRVIDYASSKKNIYLKDMVFDKVGRPICLYIRSNGHKPGPQSQPFEWCISKWNGFQWTTHTITSSDHNYDMGSLLFHEEKLYLIAPTAIGPQKWGGLAENCNFGNQMIWESIGLKKKNLPKKVK